MIFCRTFSSSLPWFPKKKIVKKFCAHPVSLTWEEFWDTRHYSDFSQKKRGAQKKEERQRKQSDFFQSVLFPRLRAAPWFCSCSRLVSLVRSSLGLAQYRRWAFIQLCISELIIADLFCYHIISLPSSTYIYVVRLTLPGNRSIQALRVLTTAVADHRLLLGKNW